MAFLNSNPILDEIDAAHSQLSPPAQQVIALAHQGIGRGIPEGPQSAGAIPNGSNAIATETPAQPAGPVSAPRPIATPSAVRGLGPAATPADPAQAGRIGEFGRLTAAPLPSTDPRAHTKADTGLAGHDQIRNPWARHGLQVLDAIGSTFLPGLTEALPGTQLHHDLLVSHAASNVNQGEAQQTEETKRRLTSAQAGIAEAQPELNQTKAELAAAKLAEATGHHQSQIDVSREREEGRRATAAANNAASLHAHGYKLDENGSIVSLPYGEMSEQQQAVHDLKASQQEVADATAALRKAQKENIPKAAELAQARIHTAQQNANTAAGRLGLSSKQFEAEYHGTDNGAPLAGATADEAGNPVGTKVAAGNKPSGQVASRAAQGTAIKKAGDALLQEIDAKKSKVGNIESYWNQAVNNTPIADPEAAGLMASLSSFAALQPALHGFRSHDALREFAKIIGGTPKNPEALKAAIRSIQNTAGIIEEGGKPRTVKPNGGPAPAPGNAPKPETWVRDASGKLVKQ